MLATDPRFMSLTDEQWELMYEHYLLDNPPKKNPSAYDPDYDKEVQDEHYHDPDFDDAWDTLEIPVQPEVEPSSDSESDDDEWEEVE